MAFKKIDPGRNFPPREMVEGDWKCAECSTPITKLPFEPSPDRPIYCRECWAKKRAERK
ncbi:MAG: hypothetical protein Q7K28_01285 [Candidatus Wildermuthbacteria bacterium]|nr:hypothetical protein [Candidatus Wildermuthbacteria bacterium]